jgi:hypothetical protein
VIVVVGWCLVAGGCVGSCAATPSAPVDSSAPWPRSSPLVQHVPHDAETAVFVRRLADLQPAVAFAGRTLPEGGLRERLADLPLPAPGDLGLADEQSMAAFRHDEHWRLVVEVDDREQFDAGLRKFTAEHAFEVVGEDKRVERITRASDGGDKPATVAAIRHRNGAAFIRPGPAPTDDGAVLPKRRRPNWPSGDARRELVGELAGDEARFLAVGTPSELVPEAADSGPARQIRERLANQLGPTGLRAGVDGDTSTLSVTIRSRSTAGEPMVVSSLGQADGKIPPLGGLVEPGVLGMARLSVDPQSTYRLLRSTLPAGKRRQLDAFWRQLRKQLLIDGPDKLLDHFTGHAFVVFYGMGSATLGEDGGPIWRRILTLQTTREIVMLPIESREKLEQFLDKMTQISRGRLSRESGEHHVQYAWFDDGSLAWALLLGDGHLMVVDSPTSLDKALAYERRGGTLGDETRQQMGLRPLLENNGRSGLYLDAGTVGRLLRENSYKRAADWLSPFRRILLTTEMDGDASSTQVELRFAE